MSPSRKTVLITGCSAGGVGNALARALHQRGLRVFATGRSMNKIADLRGDLGIECLQLDVCSSDSIKACYAQVEKLLDGDGLDYLVNNAGLLFNRPAVESNMQEVRQMFEVNCFGIMEMNQVFLPALLRAKGTIVHIGSLAAVAPSPFHAAYNASKAALFAYSDTLRIELAPLGVKVVFAYMGGVKTQVHQNQTTLAENSLYLPAEKEFLDWQNPEGQHHRKEMPVEVFADHLAGKITGGGAYIWEGANTTATRIANWIQNAFGLDVWGMGMPSLFGLNKLKK